MIKELTTHIQESISILEGKKWIYNEGQLLSKIACDQHNEEIDEEITRLKGLLTKDK